MALTREQQEEMARNRILFTLIERASGVDHWKSPFEIEMILQDPTDPPLPKESVKETAKRLAEAIQFFHGAAVRIDLDTWTSKEVKGEPAAYVLFDGYKLMVGSIGYQG